MKASELLVTALLALQATFGIVIATSPQTLGIPPVVVAWLAVLVVPVGVVLNRLDPLGRGAPPAPPAPTSPTGVALGEATGARGPGPEGAGAREPTLAGPRPTGPGAGEA